MKPPQPDESHADALARLGQWSPLYRSVLRLHPEHADWLARDENRRDTFQFADFRGIWLNEFHPDEDAKSADELLSMLQRFRRMMSLRIAYREVNNLADVRQSLQELTTLAEFCLQILLGRLRTDAESRLGRPWDEDLDRPAKLCVLGLGKLGGGELNFCSDLDLIFVYEGQGRCHRDGRPLPTSNGEFFARLCRDLCGQLQKRSAEGFLYNVDLRLRPEGEGGPIVHSLQAMEHYYYVSGQTWERLALIKARPVAGERSLGEELLEIVNPFRFPRHPPPFLLENISGVKIRTEREVVGEGSLDLHLKTGPGGIREIEFFTQALQLINGGFNPFLQTPSTLDALERLARYQIIDEDQSAMLRESYLVLRRLENAVQIREEKQTHSLPTDEQLQRELAAIAGFDSLTGFREMLGELRGRVHANYLELFKPSEAEIEIQDWTLFLTSACEPPTVAAHIRKWFGPDAQGEAVSQGLRAFVVGEAHNAITREQVMLFIDLSRDFDSLLPRLADPLLTLERVSRFARAYGAPRQFLKTCSENRRLFQALCLLFDRSAFIHRLLTERPQIIDEVLGPGYQRDKSVADHLAEIHALPDTEEFADWLWLYVKAEQVRLAIRDLLDERDATQTATALTNLADAAVAASLEAAGAQHAICVVGLGKLGSRELSFGSDLDLLLVAEDATDTEAIERARRFLAVLSLNRPLGRTFEVDLRLRPHGDAGPMLVTPAALERYHDGGGAQFWERMVMTRSRPCAGNPELARTFDAIRHGILFVRPVTQNNLDELGTMRTRIEREKGTATPPERAFKAGRGGLIDIEFLCQRFQLTHGGQHPEIRHSGTEHTLAALGGLNLVPPTATRELARSLAFLRDVERAVRRNENKGEATLDPALYPKLAAWLGLPDAEAFQNRLRTVMETTRRLVRESIAVPTFPD